jgi:drug/metabolite transporter (DMT)-like permease
VDPGLLLRLAGQWRFMAGIGLDVLGFLLELAALRSLPLFVVQAIIASSLAVTAIVAGLVMKIRLRPVEWAAIGIVCAGLALLGLSAGVENPDPVSSTVKWTLLAAVLVLAALGAAAGRLTGRLRDLMLGAVAGLGFSVVALGARAITDFDPWDLLRDPAAYALAIGGLVAMTFFATALQRGSVTTATAAVVITETVVPAALGVWLFDDSTNHPTLAITGFVLAVTGALALARFGEPPELPNTAAPACSS